MNKIILALLFLLAPLSFIQAADAPIKNAGFVPANIWYSKDPFFAGETIRIYTIIFNGSEHDLEGTVEFLDNGVSVGKTNFSLSGGGRVRDLWVDWKATEGKHVMTARIVNTTASLAGGARRTIELDNTETGKNERSIDLDTDNDGIGNTEDADDDSDGIPDVEELRNNTNPLKKDTNGDGVPDGKELEIATKQKETAEKLLEANPEPKGTILGTIKTVEENIPTPVKESAIAGVNALERFRLSEGYQARLAKEVKMKEIEAMRVAKRAPAENKDGDVLGTVSNTAEKPFAYVTYGVLSLVQYFFEWQIIFYGVILYILYRLIKWAAGRIRNRE